MVKDKNADKRLAYNRQILDIESKQDEICSQKRDMKRALDSFGNEITRSALKLRELDDEMIRQGSIAAQWAQQEHHGRDAYIHSFIDHQDEAITTVYSKMIQETEDKREALQKERNGLSWD